MPRLLLTRRWLGFTVVALLVALACLQLGRWQLHRAELRLEQAREVAARTAADPVDVATLSTPGEPVDEAAQWRIVSATGRYDAAGTLLLRNRSLDGRRGYHVLVPLRLQDATTLLADRGFVPAEGPLSAGVDVPAPPDAEVRVVGRLRDGVRVDDAGALGFAGGAQPSVSRVDVLRLGGRLGDRLTGALPLHGGFVEVTAEEPEPAVAPTRIPAPEPGNYGLNYAYAVQWWVFAVVAVVGWWLLLRREARDGGGGGGGGGPDARRTADTAARRAVRT